MNSPSSSVPPAGHGAIIAVVGCDGSGKSTLTGDLLAHLGKEHETELVYLGQGSGNILTWILGIPLIGKPLGRYLKNRSKKAHDKEDKASSQDATTALVMYLLSRWRNHKFKRMLKRSRSGATIIADRYPQAEVPGFYYDGTGLAITPETTGFVRWLAKRELRLYEKMASHLPDLLIRLNIDAETAHARKPDHKLAMLQDKVRVIPTLTFSGAHILDLDGTSPYAQVLEAALSAARTASGSAMTEGKTTIAGVVAVIGCDGTGKTTLTKDLLATLRKRGPTELRYMGLVSGETGDKIKALPVIGVAREAFLARKVRRAQDMKQKVPGLFSAIVMYLFSKWRVGMLRRLRRLAGTGVLVIADRFPQAEVPGFHYDGPGISAERTQNRLIQGLARREQLLYEQMALHRPSLVIRLMIDAETAHARKPDHPIEELRDKIAIMPRIGFNGAKICEIDARKPYDEVLAEALQAIEGVIAETRPGWGNGV